jgi:hypothetical protein
MNMEEFTLPTQHTLQRGFIYAFVCRWYFIKKLKQKLISAFPQLRRIADALGRPGLKHYQRILVFLRRIGTARSFDDLDDSSRMSEESVRKSCFMVIDMIIEYHGPRIWIIGQVVVNWPESLQNTKRLVLLDELDALTVASKFGKLFKSSERPVIQSKRW